MECHTIDKKTKKNSKLSHKMFSETRGRKYVAPRVDKLPKLCIVTFEGLRIDFESKGHPSLTQLSIEMDSLSI